jgi:ribonucleoside-diphosphate reductase alpha chain
MEDVKQWLGETNKVGIDIWSKKYRYNNESFDQWLDRVSSGNAELRQAIKERKFMFGGRTLTNRGIEGSGSFFNCYSSGFLPDSYKELLEANTALGLTYKAQGGQGVSLSKLRPRGTPIGKRFVSDGIVPFMEIFNTTTKATSQGGSRKGALMMSLDIRHKEAETFIKIKAGQNIIDKANLSLEVDDEFMQAVEEFYKTGKEVTLHETREYSGHKIEYDIVPIKLYKMLVETCYDWADPACLFTQEFRNYNLMEFDDDYQIATSNPCGWA